MQSRNGTTSPELKQAGGNSNHNQTSGIAELFTENLDAVKRERYRERETQGPCRGCQVFPDDRGAVRR